MKASEGTFCRLKIPFVSVLVEVEIVDQINIEDAGQRGCGVNNRGRLRVR